MGTAPSLASLEIHDSGVGDVFYFAGTWGEEGYEILAHLKSGSLGFKAAESSAFRQMTLIIIVDLTSEKQDQILLYMVVDNLG